VAGQQGAAVWPVPPFRWRRLLRRRSRALCTSPAEGRRKRSRRRLAASH